MLKVTQETWDEENGIAIVSILDTSLGREFTGTAHCGEEDKDMQSKLTGSNIAYRRAEIEHLRYLKKYYTIKYKTLLNFQSEISNCKYYNPEFQIESILGKKIKALDEAVAFLTRRLEIEKEALAEYLKNKSELYQKIREGRKTKE